MDNFAKKLFYKLKLYINILKITFPFKAIKYSHKINTKIFK